MNCFHQIAGLWDELSAEQYSALGKLWDELTELRGLKLDVAAERNRCAKVAGDYAAGFEAVERAEGRGWCPKCGADARNVADDISSAIREGK